MHIYDWLENFKKDECKDIHLLNLYKFLDFRTREAFWQYENIDKKPNVIVFCTYKDKRYKIVGASRLGDIWLNTDPGAENGYDVRVYIDDCTNFVSYQIDEKIKKIQTSDISRWEECTSTMKKDVNEKHAKYSNTLFKDMVKGLK